MKVIYTDGSAKGNGSKNAEGGFGVVVCDVWSDKDQKKYLVLADAYQERTIGTTNNREEMKAIIWALEHYGGEEYRGNGVLIPTVYSDSSYCVNSFTNWIQGWKANGWRRAGNKPLENLDLIKKYDELVQEGKKIDLRYIKGHNGHIWNEIADNLATGKISVDFVMTTYSPTVESSNQEEYEQLTIEG